MVHPLKALKLKTIFNLHNPSLIISQIIPSSNYENFLLINLSKNNIHRASRSLVECRGKVRGKAKAIESRCY